MAYGANRVLGDGPAGLDDAVGVHEPLVFITMMHVQRTTAKIAESARQALVTGASSGIGLSVAHRMQRAGYQVFGLARRPVPVVHSEPAQNLPSIVSVPMDLSDLGVLPEALGKLGKRLPRLELVVLAAGRGRFGSLEQTSFEQMRDLIDLNVTANLFVCRALVPILKRRGGGKVVFIGSESALRGKRQGTVYCASKFAVRGMAQALRDECSSSGVAVSVIQPGMVRTPFFDELDFEPGPATENALQPDDVAEAVEYVASSPAHAVVDEIELSPLKRVVRKRNP